MHQEEDSSMSSDIDLFVEEYSKELLSKKECSCIKEYIDENEIMNICTNKNAVIVHIYNNKFSKCLYLNKLLVEISSKYPKIDFTCIKGENAPTICSNLDIKVLPFLGFFRDGYYVDNLVGFEKIGNTERPTLEDVVNYIENSPILKL